MAQEQLKGYSAAPTNGMALPQSTQQRFKMLWEESMDNPVASECHENTHVLVLSWAFEDDDLGTGREVGRLMRTFQDTYGFHVHHTLLNIDGACIQALAALAALVRDYDKPGTLLIVYYAGHGFTKPEVQPGDILLSGKSPKPNGGGQAINLVWSHAETAIMQAKHADVLLIFDCCNAGRLCRPLKRGSGLKPHYQFLGACSAEQTTYGPGEKSFTSALIWALEQLAKEDDHFTTHRLYRRIDDYPHLPRDQVPILSDRGNWDAVGPIVICHHGLHTNASKQHRTESITKIMKDRAYLDLRFVFENDFTEERLKETAEALQEFRNGSINRKLGICRITFRSKYTAAEHAQLQWKEAVHEAKKLTPTVTSVAQAVQQILSARHRSNTTDQGGARLSATSPVDNELDGDDEDATGLRLNDALSLLVPGDNKVQQNIHDQNMIEVARELGKDIEAGHHADKAPQQTKDHTKVTLMNTTVTPKDVGPTSAASTTVSDFHSHTVVEQTISQDFQVIRQSMRRILSVMLPGGKKKTARRMMAKSPSSAYEPGVNRLQPSALAA